jgi:hypothetical protein
MLQSPCQVDAAQITVKLVIDSFNNTFNFKIATRVSITSRQLPGQKSCNIARYESIQYAFNLTEPGHFYADKPQDPHGAEKLLMTTKIRNNIQSI